MGPIASRALLFILLIAGYGAPTRADDVSQNTGIQTATAKLPAFVPSAGYKIAVSDNSASAKAARQAAETLSAKFSDMTTGSISKTEPVPKPVPVTQAPQKAGIAPETADARSIILTATHVEDPKNQRGKASDPKQAKVAQAAPKLPRAAVRKASALEDPQQLNASLAAIGQKVSFLDLLTNPALWKK